MAHFDIKNLSFTYPIKKEKSLDGVSLTIEKGEYVALCGRSGSGKTTLLRHLKTVLAPHGEKSGEVLFCGTPIQNVSLREQACKIGFVMQNPDDQIVTDKVWHELSFGLESVGTEASEMRLRVAEMACYFGIESWFERDVSTLSGGQKQLLNLASIMAMQPEVLILDEPTSQLDPIAASDFLNTVKKINIELGTTVIITEHRLESVLHSADRAVVMENGKILTHGAPADVCRYLWEKDHEMFFAMPTPARVFYNSGGTGLCPLTVREGRSFLTESFKNESPAHISPDSAGDDTAPYKVKKGEELALYMKDAYFRYEKDGEDVLRGTTIKVPKGSIFAIVGGNGAGKSTSLKAAAGIVKIYRGRVEIFGKPLKSYNKNELFHGCIAMLPQDPKSLFCKDTVYGDLKEMTDDEEKIKKASETCCIQHLLNSHPHDLSGGEQQRAALCKVLLCDPALILLDEPTKGMDSFFKEQFAGILKKLQKDGATIVIVSHDVEFCADHADFVSMFFRGQLLTTERPRKFFGQNSFYTTAANRMSRCVFKNAVTVSDVVELCCKNTKTAQKVGENI